MRHSRLLFLALTAMLALLTPTQGMAFCAHCVGSDDMVHTCCGTLQFVETCLCNACPDACGPSMASLAAAHPAAKSPWNAGASSMALTLFSADQCAGPPQGDTPKAAEATPGRAGAH